MNAVVLLRAALDETQAGAVPVEPLGLVLALVFVGAVLAVSRALRLGLERTVLLATARTYVQLSVLGLVLVYLFAWDHPLLTGAVFGVMILASAQIALTRLKEVPVPVFRPVLAATALGGVLVTAVVTGLVLGVEPFWAARYWLPIGGMVLGNSLTGIALAVERFFSEMALRHDSIEALVALGATPAEARRDALRAGLRAGMTPILNNMAAVGVVSIPGMMTGQVLAGADPQQAARYQIVVMLMIAAATALGAATAVLLAAPRAFDADGAPRDFAGARPAR
ncbi:MAG TPA: iron export ABC transporter permease subunit FetB [Planctomycetota bacterium]